MSLTVESPSRSESAQETSPTQRTLAGFRFSVPSEVALGPAIEDLLFEGRPATYATCRAMELWRTRWDRRLKKLLHSADVLVPRGSALTFVTPGGAADENVDDPGETLLPSAILDAAQSARKRVYFLGGMDCEPFDWARRIYQRYPGLRIAGASAPDVDLRDHDGCRRLVQRINKSYASVLLVVPESDRMEHFVLCYRALIRAPMIGVFWGGAPAAWQQRGRWLPRHRRSRLPVEKPVFRVPEFPYV